ncbi:vomeronasal 1 receptor ornAnaV1R3003 [Ornithorhynchus anatinus]|uniref:Vomeronasal type-1 receptor n=1 Tax=Ornithorhynchus anatinus TaxID=9258 RepID=A0A6I8N0A4_ORNAN|nr:vomeronasal 1 receptor ornAnaV1R3003 [Ornithorhynchus anatinus]
MNASELSFGVMVLLHLSIGVSVNGFLLLFYIRVVSTSHKPSSSDLILAQLALANILLLLTLGIPEALYAWGWRNFLTISGCKILMYLYRVGRGLAICTTCLLSVFQAVTLSPGTSRWARVKAKLHESVVPSCALSWVLSLLVECNVAIQMTGPLNNSSAHIMLDHKYCSQISDTAETAMALTALVTLRDVFFVGLMSLTSGYMVFVLHRHHHQVRHLQGHDRSPREMPEVRAAKRVVALVTLYVLLYGRQTLMLSVIINMKVKSRQLVNGHMLLSFTFSVLSPFPVIIGDRRMRPFWMKDPPVSSADSS